MTDNPLLRLERTDFVKTRFLALWSVLGFQAGYINAFGFLACGRYVSHVTGFGTQIGMALGNQNLLLAIEMLGFPLSFILGSFTNGFFTIARIEQGGRPQYKFILGLVLVLLLFCVGIGVSGIAGAFGEPLEYAHDFILPLTLSFVCGLQNACFATMTRGQIRTTHLTGIATDIGTDLSRVFFGKLESGEKLLTKRTNHTRLATFVAFAFGSIVSVLSTQKLDFFALLVPVVTSLAIILRLNYLLRRDKSIEQLIT